LDVDARTEELKAINESRRAAATFRTEVHLDGFLGAAFMSENIQRNHGSENKAA
jgi:hypothetical protein